jgi:hypothetical protein
MTGNDGMVKNSFSKKTNQPIPDPMQTSLSFVSGTGLWEMVRVKDPNHEKNASAFFAVTGWRRTPTVKKAHPRSRASSVPFVVSTSAGE